MQPEIYRYFKDVAAQYDIEKHVRFQSVVDDARWEATTGTWHVTIRRADGSTYKRRCKVLVSAVGALSTPKKCKIAGAETFRGRMFHSAQWDHSFDWKNKEVVVIGK